VGSVLCGPDEFIHKARRNRKLLGGGTRQAGVLAACGLYALENNIERLSEDHDNAEQLAKGLASLQVMPVEQHTNMVFINPPTEHITPLCNHLREHGIIIGEDSPTIRLVTHLDISSDDITRTIEAFKDYFRKIP
jgi:threonine aldolase